MKPLALEACLRDRYALVAERDEHYRKMMEKNSLAADLSQQLDEVICQKQNLAAEAERLREEVEDIQHQFKTAYGDVEALRSTNHELSVALEMSRTTIRYVADALRQMTAATMSRQRHNAVIQLEARERRIDAALAQSPQTGGDSELDAGEGE